MPYNEPELSQGAASGEALLSANAATQQRDLARWFQRFGVQAPEYVQGAMGTIDQARANAVADLHARLGESQLRAQLHRAKLDAMWKAYRAQKKAKKQETWAHVAGAAGQITGGLLGSLIKSPGPMDIGYGSLAGYPISPM